MGTKKSAASEPASEGNALIESIAELVIDAFDNTNSDLDATYFLGDLPDRNGKDVICIRLAAGQYKVYLIEDCFGSCWLIFHNAGTTGQIQKIPDLLKLQDVALDCCKFLMFATGHPNSS